MAWEDYYKHHDGRRLTEIYRDAVELIHRSSTALSGVAIDLGCGNGIEAADMLKQGWHVVAVDQEAEAIERVKSLSATETKIDLVHASFEELQRLPSASFVFANNSLPFCSPQQFPRLMAMIADTIKPGGFFAGTFFGPHDEWVRSGKAVGTTRAQLKTLFPGFTGLKYEGFDGEAGTVAGPAKHWHIHKVILQKK